MGFFKKIKKVAKRTVTAVATGGASEVLRATGNTDVAKTLTSVFAPTSLSDLQTGIQLGAPLVGTTLGGPIGFVGGQAVAQGFSPTPQFSSVQGAEMGISNFLGGLSRSLDNLSGFGGPIGQASQFGSAVLGGFFPASGPTVPTFPAIQPTQANFAVPVAGMAGVPSGAMMAGLKNLVDQILLKMTAFFGKSISFRAAMILVRRLAKFAQSPAAIGGMIGLSAQEVATLLIADSMKKRRRMNPGNVKALRRAHRRLESFHKLCGTNDRLRTPRRRRATPKTIVVSGKRCD